MIRRTLRLTTKTAILGGGGYFLYTSGLWSKGVDETIENYEKLKKEAPVFYDEKTPPIVKEYIKLSKDFINTNIEPVEKSWTDFKNEWLNFDMSWAKGFGTEDGIIKPMWNKMVIFVFETIAESPETIKNLSITGWNKISEITESKSNTIVIESTINNKPSLSSGDTIPKSQNIQNK